MKREIKSYVVDETVEKNFGCIHCKEDSEIVIEDMTLFVDGMSDLFQKNITGLLHKFFNSKSDANKYLEASQQESLEMDFNAYIKDTLF